MAGCCCAEACTVAVVTGVMRLPGCPFDSAWCLVCEVCRLTVDCVDCRCFLSFVFLGGARRLELSPCNTRHINAIAQPPQFPQAAGIQSLPASLDGTSVPVTSTSPHVHVPTHCSQPQSRPRADPSSGITSAVPVTLHGTQDPWQPGSAEPPRPFPTLTVSATAAVPHPSPWRVRCSSSSSS